MTTIYLIRHGQAEGNLYRRCHSWHNGLLTQKGREQAKALEDAVRRDVAAGHFGRTLFLLDDLYNQAICTGGLELYYSVTDLERPQAGPHSQTVSLSLSAYCTETLKALEDLGIVNGSRRLLTYAEQSALESEEEGVPFEGDYDPNSFPDSGSVVYPADAYVYPGEAVDTALLH